MQTSIAQTDTQSTGLTGWLRNNATIMIVYLVLVAFPFIVALLNGQAITGMLANETGSALFLQGLLIEIFILAIYAISYDLILGVTGLLSFGHAMFFAVGAYGTGIMFKNLEWGIVPTVIGIVVLGILQALLFGLVLARVKGITFALVTLGFASVFYIVIQSNELSAFTGADVGLQGIIVPDFLSTSTQRFRLYFITLTTALGVYLVYRRFVDSPTGRVCIANRENEERALMLGYNTFYFKLTALIISSITAALAGFFHAVHQPIVSPNVASLGWTVAALLMILIGGVGTLTGAYIGAAVYRLLEYFLDKWFGTEANFLLGLVYILLVLFVPYGIVGTWRSQQYKLKQYWADLTKLFTGKEPSEQLKP
ncbi:MAG: branched-chain amino acid ABC transporter permease [Chloroflexota bacterium]